MLKNISKNKKALARKMQITPNTNMYPESATKPIRSIQRVNLKNFDVYFIFMQFKISKIFD